MIYHIITASDWQKAQGQGFYKAASLALEGFIHMSQAEQVKGVLQRYYTGQANLLLLHVDEKKLTAPLKYEIAPSVNEAFPHIFGNLNIDAVVDVTDI
jgi:uncharacterized protein (DUF952 family)